MTQPKITPEYALALNKPTEAFLCPLSANIYNIQFLSFRVRDVESGYVLFEIARDENDPDPMQELENSHLSPEEEAEYRTVRYHFGPDFFKLKTIGTTLTFSVGDKPVKNFRMIERHYFRNHLLHSYDFTFPFCIPNSTNDWEAMYSIPNVTNDMKKEMIAHPYETMSDSFYFVDGELVMHNKAEYDYSPFEDEQQ